jgi:heterodisulfide reductase subunit A-like polyferredoxin
MPRGDGTGPMGRGPGMGRGMGGGRGMCRGMGRGLGKGMSAGMVLRSLPVQPSIGRTGLLAIVDRSQCAGCAACENACPVQAIVTVDGIAQIDNIKCTGCGLCQAQCPNGAISLRNR